MQHPQTNRKEADIDSGDIQVFITKDQDLCNQYYQIRNDIFQNERGWTKKTWFENDSDRNGNIIVATNSDGVVIGGMRLMISSEAEHLSGEIPGTKYTYKNLFEDFDIDCKKYSEADAIVVLKAYRNRKTTEKILDLASRHSAKLNCEYLIGVAFITYCRLYRAVF